MPLLTVIAGPNGSGKSTVTRRMEFEGKERLLDPDAIAKRIDPENPTRAAVAAGRETIRRTREYLETALSFSVETTMASNGPTETMRRARELGFTVHLWYVCLDNPERNIRRVNERALSGGHDVPDADIRRRYERSLANLPEALLLAHQASVFDNGSATARLVLRTLNGEVTWLAPDAPAWVLTAVQALSVR